MPSDTREIFVSEFTVPGDPNASNDNVIRLFSDLPPGSRRLVLTPDDRPDPPVATAWFFGFGHRHGTPYAINHSNEVVYRATEQTPVEIVLKTRDAREPPFLRNRDTDAPDHVGSTEMVPDDTGSRELTIVMPALMSSFMLAEKLCTSLSPSHDLAPVETDTTGYRGLHGDVRFVVGGPSEGACKIPMGRSA
jgi:hypothetical protein